MFAERVAALTLNGLLSNPAEGPTSAGAAYVADDARIVQTTTGRISQSRLCGHDGLERR